MLYTCAAAGLQTLADISDALNDDDDYAAGITTALGTKASKAGPVTYTGTHTFATVLIPVTGGTTQNLQTVVEITFGLFIILHY